MTDGDSPPLTEGGRGQQTTPLGSSSGGPCPSVRYRTRGRLLTDGDENRRESFCSLSSVDSFAPNATPPHIPHSPGKHEEIRFLSTSPRGLPAESGLGRLTESHVDRPPGGCASEATTSAASETSSQAPQEFPPHSDALGGFQQSDHGSTCDTVEVFGHAYIAGFLSSDEQLSDDAFSSDDERAPSMDLVRALSAGSPVAGLPLPLSSTDGAARKPLSSPSRLATATRRTPQSSMEGFSAMKKETPLRHPASPPTVASRLLPSRRCQWLRALPVVFLMVLIAYILAVFVMYHAVPLLQLNLPQSMKLASAYNRGLFELVSVGILTMLFLISYWLAVITPPGSIPDTQEWSYTGSDASDIEGLPSAVETKKTGARRHCKWCRRLKPDRAHHCRVCRQCVLKMDHHCPWIYNCVGWRNHKYFMLSLIYGSLDSLLIAICMFETVKSAVASEKTEFEKMFMVLFAETLDIFLCVLITGFFLFHIHLVRNGMTTIEFCEKQFKRPRVPDQGSLWNKGCWKNFTDAFGTNPLVWFLPIDNRPGDGVHFITEDTRLLYTPGMSRTRAFEPIIESTSD